MTAATHDTASTARRPAPGAEFLDAAGRALGLGDLLRSAGGLPLLLVFFKVGCPTCQLVWPYLQKFHEALGGRAVRVAGVCQDSAEEGAAHYERFGPAAFDLLLDPGPRFAASNAFGVEAVPHHVLVAPDGTEAKTFTGWSTREMNTLALELSHALGPPARPLVDPADPVKEWQAG